MLAFCVKKVKSQCFFLLKVLFLLTTSDSRCVSQCVLEKSSSNVFVKYVSTMRGTKGDEKKLEPRDIDQDPRCLGDGRKVTPEEYNFKKD